MLLWIILGIYICGAVLTSLIYSLSIIHEKAKYEKPENLPWEEDYNKLISYSIFWPGVIVLIFVMLIIGSLGLVLKAIDKLFNRLAKIKKERNESRINGKDTK